MHVENLGNGLQPLLVYPGLVGESGNRWKWQPWVPAASPVTGLCPRGFPALLAVELELFWLVCCDQIT